MIISQQTIDKLKDEFGENAIYFYKNKSDSYNGNETNPKDATIMRFGFDKNMEYINQELDMPSKKEVTFDYVMNRLGQRSIYKSFVEKFSELMRLNNAPGTAYPTTYGIGIWNLFQSDKGKRIIANLLDQLGVKYTTEFSDAHYVYRYKISKSSINIKQIDEAIQKAKSKPIDPVEPNNVIKDSKMDNKSVILKGTREEIAAINAANKTLDPNRVSYAEQMRRDYVKSQRREKTNTPARIERFKDLSRRLSIAERKHGRKDAIARLLTGASYALEMSADETNKLFQEVINSIPIEEGEIIVQDLITKEPELSGLGKIIEEKYFDSVRDYANFIFPMQVRVHIDREQLYVLDDASKLIVGHIGLADMKIIIGQRDMFNQDNIVGDKFPFEMRKLVEFINKLGAKKIVPSNQSSMFGLGGDSGVRRERLEKLYKRAKKVAPFDKYKNDQPIWSAINKSIDLLGINPNATIKWDSESEPKSPEPEINVPEPEKVSDEWQNRVWDAIISRQRIKSRNLDSHELLEMKLFFIENYDEIRKRLGEMAVKAYQGHKDLEENYYYNRPGIAANKNARKIKEFLSIINGLNNRSRISDDLISYFTSEFLSLMHERKNLNTQPEKIINQVPAIRNMIIGNDTTIYTPDGPIEAKYALMELYDLIPSNNPFTFKPNPEYRVECQTRDYEKEKAEQLAVEDFASHFTPRLFIFDANTATDGSPIIVSTAEVLGGNKRTMSLFRVAQSGDYSQYIDLFVKNSQIFGFKASDVETFTEPVLVRLVDVDTAKCGYYSELFNKSMTQKRSTENQAAGYARQLSEHHQEMQMIIDAIESSEGESLSEILRQKGTRLRIIDALVRAHVISKNEINEWSDNDGFTDKGELYLKNILTSFILPNKQLIDTVPSYTNAIVAAIGTFIRMKNLPAEWNLIPTVQDVIKLEAERSAKKFTFDMMMRQEDAFSGPIPEMTCLVWSVFNNNDVDKGRPKPLVTKKVFSNYVKQAEQSSDPNSFFENDATPLKVLKKVIDIANKDENVKIDDDSCGDSGLSGYDVPEENVQAVQAIPESVQAPEAEITQGTQAETQVIIPEEVPVNMVAAQNIDEPIPYEQGQNITNIEQVHELPIPTMTKLKRTKYLFDGKMLDHCNMLIWGSPGSGKSSFSLMLAQDFAENGKVLYFMTEEKIADGRLANRLNLMQVSSPQIDFDDSADFFNLREDIESGKYKYVFVDSMNMLNIQQEDAVALFDQYPQVSFIFVAHATKDKKSYSGVSLLDHKVDTTVKIEDGIAETTKHRDGEKRKMPVFSRGTNKTQKLDLLKY